MESSRSSSALAPPSEAKAKSVVPWVVTVVSGDLTSVLLYPSGELVVKQHDDGKGASTRKVRSLERLLYTRSLKRATEQAWSEYEEQFNQLHLAAQQAPQLELGLDTPEVKTTPVHQLSIPHPTHFTNEGHSR